MSGQCRQTFCGAVMTRSDELDWRPGCSLEMLKARADLQQCIRDFFSSLQYLEVDTPLLSHDTVVDVYLNPFVVAVDGRSMFLQTSPEASMKRLLAAGSGSIFQITKSFRSAEQGVLHNPEFTMLEWYGVETTWRDQLSLTEQLIRSTAASIVNKHQIPLSKEPFKVTTYQAAFRRHLSIDVLAASMDELRACGATCLSGSPLPDQRDNLLNLLLVEKIEPQLGVGTPEFLVDYPISQAALAESAADDLRVARRFELYIDGVELCNGYQELTDARELRRREGIQQAQRRQMNSSELPGARQLLSAMDSGLPNCSGVALGFDRLLMWLTGSPSLDECLPFSIARA